MRVEAVGGEPGVYRFLGDGVPSEATAELGGMVVDGEGTGVGFLGAVADRWVFRLRSGVLRRSVSVEREGAAVGALALGVTDDGVLEVADRRWEWRLIGSSRAWFDEAGRVVVLFDLERSAATSPGILAVDDLPEDDHRLLVLAGWHAVVLERRAAVKDRPLAGAPARLPDRAPPRSFGKDGVDVLLDASRLLE